MMHPILVNRVRFMVWWLVWLFLGLGQSLLFYFAYGSFISISIIDSLVSLLIYSGIALALWYPFRFFNSGQPRVTALISNLLTTGALTVTIMGITDKVHYDHCSTGTNQLPGILG